MQILDSTEVHGQFSKEGSSVTIGNFDGCHIGHQKLIETAKVQAKNLSCKSGVITFDPSPNAFFRNEGSLLRIFSKKQKLRALFELGIDFVLIEKFDHVLASLSHDEYFNRLILGFGVRALSIGENFRFGKSRLGGMEYLKSACHQSGTVLNIHESLFIGGSPVSSSRIRKDLSGGNVEEVSRLLGRPFLIEGKTEKGEQNGRKIGFPTLNLLSEHQLLPALGVYCGYASLIPNPAILRLSKQILPAVINVGVRPTLTESGKVKVEAHVIGESLSVDYGKPMGLYFVKKIREEMRFDGLQQLKEAIAKDVDQAKNFLLNCQIPRDELL